MESDNGFGAGIETPTDDPFKETSMSEFDQSATDPLGEVEGKPPLVDKEGNKIEGETQVESPEEQAMRESAEAELAEQEAGAPVADPPPAAAEAASSEEPGAAAGSEPTAAEVGTGMAQAEAAQEAAAETVGAVASEVVDPPQADAPASSATPTSDPETPSSPAARAAAAPATSPADDGPTSASATETASNEPKDPNVAPVPEELKDKSGAITHRRYIILTPEGNGKHREVTWYEDKAGKMVKKGSHGARKQSIALARGQEEALAVGYNAMGSPEGGVPLRAVAMTYWGELTHVEPDPDPPIRQRLKFRR